MLQYRSIFVAAFLAVFTFGCGSEAGPHLPPTVDEPPFRGGVALSFDDDFVDQWYEARPLFQRYGARVTFFVTRFHQLDADEVEKLRRLEADGHEIGCHGVDHLDARPIVEAHGAQRYVEEQVDPALEAMAREGFTPASFAYPWGGRTPELDELLARRFPVRRGSGRLSKLERSLVERKGAGYVVGASIDTNKASAEEVLAAVREAHARKRILVVYAHRITDEPTDRSHVTTQALEALLEEASALGMRFYTMAELAGAPAPGTEVMYDLLDEGSIENADMILEDRWPIPRFDPVYLGWPLTWTEDPYGENYWRFIFYSLRETRHLLWAYRTTLKPRYLEKLRAILIDFDARAGASPWIREKHGAAFRAMVMTNVYWKLWRMNALDPELEAALRRQVRAGGAFLANPKNFEGHANHGVTQAAALLLLATAFPDEREAPGWRALALERIESLIDGMVDADGVQIEQSPYYHFYVLEFFQQIDAWADAHLVHMGSSSLGATVDRMVRFATYIGQPDGMIPLLGASIRFDVQRGNPRSLDAAAEADEHFAWVRSGGARGVPPEPDSVLFPVAGFSILRSGFEMREAETQAIVDVGPYRTDHSHLDALHLHLYAAGRPLLVDSGLYTYEQGEAFDYFHGTRAHNTVVVDGRDQDEGSAIAAGFHAGSGWAWQSGRHALYPGVVHRRGVLLLRRDLVLVLDQLESGRSHDYEQLWHLFPGAAVEVEGKAVRVREEAGAEVLRIRPLLEADVALHLAHGETAPKQGWYSETYENEVPIHVVSYARRGNDAAFATLFVAGELVDEEIAASASFADGAWNVQVDVAGEPTELRVDDLGLDSERFEFSPLATGP